MVTLKRITLSVELVTTNVPLVKQQLHNVKLAVMLTEI